MDTNKTEDDNRMTNAQIWFGLVIAIALGYFVGYSTLRTTWEKRYIPVEYDVIKNTEGCAELGGYIVAAPAYMDDTSYDDERISFKCRLPERTFPLSQASSSIVYKGW